MPIERKHVERVVITEETLAMVCDCCGKRRVAKDNPDACNWYEGFHTWRLSGYFGSSFPGDMEEFEFCVCEDCLKAWVDKFKTLPLAPERLY